MTRHAGASSESSAARLRRMAMRSERRGIKEMDLILGRFARDRLADMDAPALALYDALLAESDQDLYRWVTRQDRPPARFGGLIAEIARHAGVV